MEILLKSESFRLRNVKQKSPISFLKINQIRRDIIDISAVAKGSPGGENDETNENNRYIFQKFCQD